MKKVAFQVAALFALISLRPAWGYNHPSCDDWPSESQWDRELRAKLSDPAHLHGPFYKRPGKAFVRECLDSEYLGTDDAKWINEGKGICTMNLMCAAENCDDKNDHSNLPAYTVEAHTVSDIQEALHFANTHDLPVAVKATGHSGSGQSTYPNALLIWMRHFKDEQEDRIIDDYDPCNLAEEPQPVLHMRGSATFLEAMNIVGHEHHIVTGFCPTVSLSGGWLLGGGLSFTARKYGLGVDNVVEMDVVTANGDKATANVCENQELFWALRGGGGGNFAIVTSIKYKLHTPTPITRLELDYNPSSFTISSYHKRRIRDEWLKFFYDELPKMDREWGGVHGVHGVRLFFTGGKVAATESSFFLKVEQWYDNTLTTDTFDPAEHGFVRPSAFLTEFKSWKALNFSTGIPVLSSWSNPALSAAAVYEGLWMVPQDMFLKDAGSIRDLVSDISRMGGNVGSFGNCCNYIFGGVIMDVADDATAVGPHLRKALLGYFVGGEGWDRMRELAPPTKGGGISFNHMFADTPNYIEYSWGDNYNKLLGIKNEVDPNHRFNVYQGVGYDSNMEPACEEAAPSSLGWWYRFRLYVAQAAGLVRLLFESLF